MVDRKCRMGRWASVALSALALLLGACRGPYSTPRSRAAVTGSAWPCRGLTTSAGAARFLIHVVLTRRSRVVATQVVPGGTMYRFIVAPGTYVVSSDAQHMKPVQFMVRPGDVDHVDLTPPCK